MDNNLPTSYSPISKDELTKNQALGNTLKLHLLEVNSYLGKTSSDSLRASMHKKLEVALIGTPLFVFSPQDAAIQECNLLDDIFSDGISVYISSNLAHKALPTNNLNSAALFSDTSPEKQDAFICPENIKKILYSFGHAFSDGSINPDKSKTVILTPTDIPKIRVIDAEYFFDVLSRRDSRMSYNFTGNSFPDAIEIINGLKARDNFATLIDRSSFAYSGMDNDDCFYSSWLKNQLNLVLSLESSNDSNLDKIHTKSPLNHSRMTLLAPDEINALIGNSTTESRLAESIACQIVNKFDSNSLAHLFFVFGPGSPIKNLFPKNESNDLEYSSFFHKTIITHALSNKRKALNWNLSDTLIGVDALAGSLPWWNSQRTYNYFLDNLKTT